MQAVTVHTESARAADRVHARHPVHTSRPAIGWMLCCGLISILSTSASASAGADGGDCRIGTYTYAEFDRAAALQPLAGWLQEHTACRWQIEVLASPNALAEAMSAGRLDWAVPNLVGHLHALRAAPGLEAGMRVAVPPADAARYRSLLLARRGSVADLAELKSKSHGLRLGLTFADSASGGLVPLSLLADAGLDARADFAELRYTGRHDASLRLLLAGELDVIGLPADLLPPEQAGAVVVLAESTPIPVGAMLCGGRIAERCETLAEALLAEPRADRVVQALAAAWPEFGAATRFEAAPAQDYAALLASLPSEPPQ